MTQDKNGQINDLLNALQLSINAVISGGRIDGNTAHIDFTDNATKDKKCLFFATIVHGQWSKQGKMLSFKFKDENEMKGLWSLLMMTRLSEENIKSILSMDHEFSWLKTFFPLNKQGVEATFQDVPSLSKFMFDLIKQKKMSVREISESTGLSQVSIFHFKNGSDIRLSNFLQIARALGLDVILKPKKSRKT